MSKCGTFDMQIHTMFVRHSFFISPFSLGTLRPLQLPIHFE